MTWNFLKSDTTVKTCDEYRSISTLVVKVTHRCNLDCSYCYESITSKGRDMELATFEQLCQRIFPHSDSPCITLLFHGGEPLLISTDWYEKAFGYAQELGRKYKKDIRFSMQTNLLFLSEGKLELLRKYSVQPGISLDTGIHAKNSERGGEDKVYRNFLKLKEAGIRCGILSTINHSNWNQFGEICDFLMNQAGVRKFKANVALPVGNAFGQVPLSAEQIHRAEMDIIEFMMASEGGLVEDNLMLEIGRFFGQSTKGSSLCHEATCGAGKKVMGVTPDGNLLPCGRFAWNDASYFLGNVFQSNSTLPAKLASFLQEKPENWNSCSSCRARSICRFGCQAFIVRSKEKINLECTPTQMRYDYFVKNRSRLESFFDRVQNKRTSLVSSDFSLTISSKGIQTK